MHAQIFRPTVFATKTKDSAIKSNKRLCTRHLCFFIYCCLQPNESVLFDRQNKNYVELYGIA